MPKKKSNKYKQSFKQRRQNRKQEKQRSNDEDGQTYVLTTVEHGNFKMEAYYAAQGLHNYRFEGDKLVECTTDEERNEERKRWRTIIGKILPASFRIGKNVPATLREAMESELKGLLDTCQSDQMEGPIITKLSFLEAGYQLGLDRAAIRKDPKLVPLFDWLKEQTSTGFITRQETVSMIPPVVLDPQPSHAVLDMCAAPGSKSSQLLEALGPDGSLIANDANAQRAHMLVHQLRRITNNPVVLVTHCQAQFFPSVLQFDRILCDVPCSGDGTSRKNIGIWKSWTCMSGLGLHALQIDIAWKGIANLLKVGGYMVYSTCSFNPMENEAVVAELLRRSQGALELVDTKLDGFKTRPGMRTWKVFCEAKSRRQMKDADKKNNAKMQAKRKQFQGAQRQENGAAEEEVTKEEPVASEPGAKGDAPVSELETDVANTVRKFEPTKMDETTLIELAESGGLKYLETPADVDERFKTRVRESCFPPTEDFPLERCVRCLPQDNDTGGFFIALLKKVVPIGKADRTNLKAEADESQDDDEDSEPDVKRAKVDEQEAEDAEMDFEGLDEDNRPVCTKGNLMRDADGGLNAELGKDDFVSVKDELIDPLIDYYGLTMPGFRKDLYMARAGSECKIVYYIGPSVKKMIDLGLQKRVTVINSGLKGFVRNNQESLVRYRIAQDGVEFLAPFMTKRKVVIGRDDFMRCLEGGVVPFAELSEEFVTAIKPFDAGAFVAVLKGYEDQYDQKMMLTLWRCRGEKLDGLVAKVELQVIKSKLLAIEAALGKK